MDSLIKSIFPCFPLGTKERGIQLSTEKEADNYPSEKALLQPSTYGDNQPRLSSDEAASSIVSAMLDASHRGPSLDATIQSLVHQAGGWSEYLATKILAALEQVLRAGKAMNPAMQKAYDKACEAAKEFEQFEADHPIVTAVFCTIIALGVLTVLAPYVVELVGFGELGPIEGMLRSLYTVHGEEMLIGFRLQGAGQLLGNLGTWASYRNGPCSPSSRGLV